jgi:hypothetical protein
MAKPRSLDFSKIQSWHEDDAWFEEVLVPAVQQRADWIDFRKVAD